MLFAAATGMLLSAANVGFRDVSRRCHWCCS
jgi:hypothetical protein